MTQLHWLLSDSVENLKSIGYVQNDTQSLFNVILKLQRKALHTAEPSYLSELISPYALTRT